MNKVRQTWLGMPHGSRDEAVLADLADYERRHPHLLMNAEETLAWLTKWAAKTPEQVAAEMGRATNEAGITSAIRWQHVMAEAAAEVAVERERGEEHFARGVAAVLATSTDVPGVTR